MTYKTKKLAILAFGVFCLITTAVLVTGRKAQREIRGEHEIRFSVEKLRKNAEAIAMLKAKCGFETKVENEAACECEADRRINENVDEVQALVMEDASIEYAEIDMADGRKITVKSLIESRRPISPECPQ